MGDFTLIEFRQIVDKCFETEESAALDDASLDTTFEELGFDSIVVYEIAVRIQDEYRVAIADGDLDELKTPGALIRFVDTRVSASD